MEVHLFVFHCICEQNSHRIGKKKYASQNKHWARRSLRALYLGRTENQAGWHCRVMDCRGDQIISGTICDFEPFL